MVPLASIAGIGRVSPTVPNAYAAPGQVPHSRGGRASGMGFGEVFRLLRVPAVVRF